MNDFSNIREHLVRTGRLKLLPRILRELKKRAIREIKIADRKETAKKNPSLLSGEREIRGGVLVDTTGKRALLEIYKKSIS
jgi:hypothetical protein